MAKSTVWEVFFLCCAIAQLQPDATHAFAPNKIGTSFRGSLTHKKITTNAVSKMAKIFTSDHAGQFHDQDRALTTKAFTVAIESFAKGAIMPDTEDAWVNFAPAHFDSEQIVEANDRLVAQRRQVIVAIQGGDMTKAQELTGQLLHALQDFYSHTNWLELGNTEINGALADPEERDNIGYVAELGLPTCTNCNTESCHGNIRPSIISDKILTSGYVYLKTKEESEIDPSEYKPANKYKCSRGGKADITSKIPATGGINKDTTLKEYSPHHYYHEKAAALAEEASLEFLKGIRAVTSEDEFARYLGLVSGTSLCFVIDTTGSMSDEIAAVREWTIDFTKQKALSADPPVDYLLVPFNDPDYGPVYRTSNSEEMIEALSSLQANGGGDGPELYYHGLLEALAVARPGSSCYTFTDAPAKDKVLMPSAVALAVANKIKVDVVLTNSGGRKRRKRSASEYEDYHKLATASGGHLVKTSKSNIGETIKIVEFGIGTTEVTLIRKNDISSTNHTIPVDATLSNVVISITGSIRSLTLINTNGVAVSPDNPVGAHNITNVIDTSTVKVYSILLPTPGMWTVQVFAYSQYSIAVTGQSLVSFSYQFVKVFDVGLGGYKEIDGQPVGDGEQIMVLNIQGATSHDGDGGIQSFTDVVFMTTNGTELKRHSLVELEPLEEYQISTTLPTQGFRVVLEGVDMQGNKLVRCDPAVVQKTEVAVEVIVDTLARFTAEPGEKISINITVHNTGTSRDTYALTVSDSRGFFQQIVPASLSLDPGMTDKAVATFQVPENASHGAVSTVSVTCTGSSNSNYVVFRINTLPKTLDLSAPECAIEPLSKIGDCSKTQKEILRCEKDIWSIQFSTQDKGIGLNTIKTLDVYAEGNFTVDQFKAGTNDMINGTYRSDCCVPRVTIVASDRLGNSGKCHIEYDTTPTPKTAGCNKNWNMNLFIVVFVLLAHCW